MECPKTAKDEGEDRHLFDRIRRAKFFQLIVVERFSQQIGRLVGPRGKVEEVLGKDGEMLRKRGAVRLSDLASNRESFYCYLGHKI